MAPMLAIATPLKPIALPPMNQAIPPAPRFTGSVRERRWQRAPSLPPSLARCPSGRFADVPTLSRAMFLRKPERSLGPASTARWKRGPGRCLRAGSTPPPIRIERRSAPRLVEKHARPLQEAFLDHLRQRPSALDELAECLPSRIEYEVGDASSTPVSELALEDAIERHTLRAMQRNFRRLRRHRVEPESLRTGLGPADLLEVAHERIPISLRRRRGGAAADEGSTQQEGQ